MKTRLTASLFFACLPLSAQNSQKVMLHVTKVDRTAAWDSVAHVTLLATIAEAFGQSFELEDFEELVSYSLIMNRLENPSPDA
jgi:acyl carrier protein